MLRLGEGDFVAVKIICRKAFLVGAKHEARFQVATES